MLAAEEVSEAVAAMARNSFGGLRVRMQKPGSPVA
jgi:hypothetical protein